MFLALCAALGTEELGGGRGELVSHDEVPDPVPFYPQSKDQRVEGQ